MYNKSSFNQGVSLLSGVVESVMIVCALYITLSVKFFDPSSYQQDIYIILAITAVALFLLFSRYLDLNYRLNTKNLIHHIIQIFIIWSAVFLLTLFFISFADDIHAYSRAVLSVWFILSLVFIVFSHMILNKLHNLIAQYKKIKRLGIVGINENSLDFLQRLINVSEPDYTIKGFYDDDESRRQELGHFAYCGGIEQLIHDVKKGLLDEVCLAFPLEHGKKIKTTIKLLNDSAIAVYWIPDISISTRFLNRRLENIADKSVVNIHSSPFKADIAILKRLEDLVLSFLILLFISPLMLIIAFLIKLTSSGPILFKQTRYGLYGEKIEVWKFRSMTSEDNGAHVRQVTKYDRRVTPFGAFLRRTSLDELPQFINVLQGQMSIVGPRPHAVAHNEEYRKLIAGYMLRHVVKPGITGWAQVNGWRGETDTLYKMEKRIEFDLRYIREWSLWLDIKIIILTFVKGFLHKNAY